MKKLIAIIFLITYFVTSSGATMQLHYCMDKLVDWSLSTKDKAQCGSCGMEKKGQKECCHDENIFFTINKDIKTSTPNFDFLKLTLYPFKNRFEVIEQHFAVNPVITYPSTNAPPLIVVPIYLYNSVFRI